MSLEGSDRRRAVRREPQSDEALSRVRLRTGRELSVVNISTAGALVEGLTRLLPNTHTDLHIITRHGRVLVRARVVRALVWRLERDLVCYRTALAFHSTVDTDAGVEAHEPMRPGLYESVESPVAVSSDPHEPRGYSVPAEIAGNFGGPGTRYPTVEAADRS